MKETRKLSVVEAADIVRDENGEKNKMNVLAGIEITILGVRLVAEYVKKAEGGYTVYLAPVKADDTKSHNLQDLINALDNLFGGKIEQSALKAWLGESLKDVSVNLAMVFLYIDKDKDDKTSAFEYAFQIKVNNVDKLIPEKIRKFLGIEDAQCQLAIWNTDRKKVKDEMKLITPEDFLKDL